MKVKVLRHWENTTTLSPIKSQWAMICSSRTIFPPFSIELMSRSVFWALSANGRHHSELSDSLVGVPFTCAFGAVSTSKVPVQWFSCSTASSNVRNFALLQMSQIQANFSGATRGRSPRSPPPTFGFSVSSFPDGESSFVDSFSASPIKHAGWFDTGRSAWYCLKKPRSPVRFWYLRKSWYNFTCTLDWRTWMIAVWWYGSSFCNTVSSRRWTKSDRIPWSSLVRLSCHSAWKIEQSAAMPSMIGLANVFSKYPSVPSESGLTQEAMR